jgi:hypothetical protein
VSLTVCSCVFSAALPMGAGQEWVHLVPHPKPHPKPHTAVLRTFHSQCRGSCHHCMHRVSRPPRPQPS